MMSIIYISTIIFIERKSQRFREGLTAMADKSAHKDGTHKERTRARILDEAAQALRAGGTEGVSVAALMKRAGLTHGGFYAHFASRDDLVAHAVGRMFEDSGAMLERYLGDDPKGPELAALIDAYLSETALHLAERGCPLPALAGEAPRMPAAARARFERGVEAFRARLARALEGAGCADAEALAGSVLAEMVGAMTLARAGSDEPAALALLAASRRNLKDRLGL
jgi:TetR/AcrR family transcriptional repressor of nem operon